MNINTKEILNNFKQSKYFFLKNTKKFNRSNRKKQITLKFKKKFNAINIGCYQIKIAETKNEMKKAQSLRYQVFFKEKNAKANFKQKIFKRDFDLHDLTSDHLIVIDKSKNNKIVGTYRLLRGTIAKINYGYYSETEFDLTNIKKIFSSKSILELGRSCVNSNYRSGRILKLLWYGIANYIQVYEIKVLFGCASFHGVDISNIEDKLSYLRKNFSLPKKFEIKSCQKNPSFYKDKEIRKKVLFTELPPLIKGYLRAGAMVSHEYFIDYNFNTIDLCALVFTDSISNKYKKKFLY